MTIKGMIFDYGGTLDTAGCHWGKMLWHAYERQQIPVTEQQFRDAYVFAERTLGRNPIIQPDDTFHRTLSTKIRLEMEHLCTQGAWDASEDDFKQKHQAVLDDLYDEVKCITAHSAEVLSELHKRFPMVLVSNFYGNIACVLREFGLEKFFLDIVESAVVGIRKPDPKIFTLGVESLNSHQSSPNNQQPSFPQLGGARGALLPSEILVVGDSFYKDIVPAQKAGCKTAWFKGEGWTEEAYDETIPDLIINDLKELI
ncbi:MAG: HAD family hydrolase [Prevotella sp.]|nr:HAD family hydrolase [Prevotella sp.]MBR6444952.1 HAD family hydrolase [Prevotella sp.]MBR6495333.1 HAD family hydrolase [Prevotella sp.]